MADYQKGDKVYITDYPLGRPLNISGTVVGVLSNDYYNVLMDNGLNEGKILKFKYWSLVLNEEQI